MFALIEDPSMTPEVEEIERLPELNVKLLPDCVIVKLAPAPVKDCVQGKLAAFVESTWIAQRPPTEMGALSFCPSLNTPLREELQTKDTTARNCEFWLSLVIHHHWCLRPKTA